MSIDAMKQALEALEQYADYEGTTPLADKAITALRLAIEQAEKQEPVARVAGRQSRDGRVLTYLDTHPPLNTPLYTAPPQRQPEKFVCGVDVEGSTVTAIVVRRCDDGVMEVIHAEQISLLPQRQPLTPDAVFKIADQHPVEGFDPDIMAFARAIERAHGIGGGE